MSVKRRLCACGCGLFEVEFVEGRKARCGVIWKMQFGSSEGRL